MRRMPRRSFRPTRVMRRNQYIAQQRERQRMQQKLQEAKKENLQLKQRIATQDLKAKQDAENKTLYQQQKEVKKKIFEALSPSLGSITIESPQIATGVAMMPWAIILLALLTREG